ncbi:MAG: Ig-like domain-containing protein [Eubacteriales bacterium]|nr:Ig-like domain-containing protein [Eubacteriales bacterium]
MRNMKRILSMFLLLMFLSASSLPASLPSPFVTQAEAAVGKVKVTKVTLTTTRLTIVKGETTTLGAYVSPENATNEEVSWKSSNKKVATVDRNGVIKGIKQGTAKITATAKDGSGKKATCKVTVKTTVPNVNNGIISLTAPQAAKKLWLNQKFGIGSQRVYLKGETTSRKGQLQTRIIVHYKRENKKGMWDLFILDKSVSFYGVKVGMAKNRVDAALKKAKWKKTKEETETTWDGYTNAYYKSKDRGSYAYKNKGVLEVCYDENGKVWMMYYSID